MPEQRLHMRLFVAAPDELADDRAAADRVVQEWNIAPGQSFGVWLEAIAWKSHATPAVGDRGQAIINKQILDSSDIVVGLFWTHFGAGTEEEIRRSIEQKKPVLIYFSDRPVQPSQIMPESMARVHAFKQEFRDKSLYWQYSSLEEFKDNLRKHLTQTIHGMLLDGPGASTSIISDSLLSRLLRLFISTTPATPPSDPAATSSTRGERDRLVKDITSLQRAVGQRTSLDERGTLLRDIADLQTRVQNKERSS
jgi:hypothetical protein